MTETPKPHYNLYYIFKSDHENNPMPQDKLDQMRSNLHDYILNRKKDQP